MKLFVIAMSLVASNVALAAEWSCVAMVLPGGKPSVPSIKVPITNVNHSTSLVENKSYELSLLEIPAAEGKKGLFALTAQSSDGSQIGQASVQSDTNFFSLMFRPGDGSHIQSHCSKN